MSMDLPPNSPKQMEERVTALLLGQLSPEEAAEVQQALEQDPVLAALHSRLTHTIDLVREAASTAESAAAEPNERLQLSAERRARLQAAFQTASPSRSAGEDRRVIPWIVPMSIAALVIVSLGLVVLSPGLAPNKKSLAHFEARRSSLPSVRFDEARQLADAPVKGKKDTFAKAPALPADKEQRTVRMKTVETPKSTAEPTSQFGFALGNQPGKPVLSSPVVPPLESYGRTAGNLRAETGISESELVAGVSGGLPIPRWVAGVSGGFGGGGAGFGGFGETPPPGQNRQAWADFSSDGSLSLFVPPASRPAGAPLQEVEKAGKQEALLDGAPVLGEVPGLGQLFRSEKQQGLDAGALVAREEQSREGLFVPDGKGLQQRQESELTNGSVALGYWVRGLDESKLIQDTLASATNSSNNKLAKRGFEVDRLSDLAVSGGRDSRRSAEPPTPEVQTAEHAFSTFSLNVSDVSYRLAAASLEKGLMPDPATVRSEEFINAFDYRDPEPGPAAAVGFAWEQARYPFAHDRDVLRLSIKTAASGRQGGAPLHLVLLLDRSGSMERADRVQIVKEASRVLARQLQPQDHISIVTFARTAHLWAEWVSAAEAGSVLEQVSNSTPEGGTNLEEALALAYETALKHYVQGGRNRVVLLTDGAANLGNVDPDALTQTVEKHRQQGIALDCFGIGWEGLDDYVLETLARHGDGRYRFLNSPEEAASGFAAQLAGALQVAAADVKVQVEFNPQRVRAYRQVGYAKHQLRQEQFRDNAVDAAEIGAAESGTALYIVQVNPQGQGQIATVRVRFKTPGTNDYHEQEWTVPYGGQVPDFETASASLRLATVASAFSEWLASSPFAAEVKPDRLLAGLSGVSEVYGPDARPKQLEWMIRQAKSLAH